MIISDIAMSRQLLKDGANAVVVANSDPAEWTKRIGEVLDSNALQQQLREGGLALSEQFSVAGMVSSYEVLYAELVNTESE